ncbi:MAG TPA: hypothetical protein PLN42_04670 [Anaerolineae bacterium]|nr:hypothetical protein [Anaerolineae bacterium]
MSAGNPLPVEVKFILGLAVIAACIVGAMIGWFVYDAGIKAQLYRECLAMTERVAGEGTRSLPTCYYR